MGPTVEIVSDGDDLFVLADGVKIAKRPPAPRKPALGYRSNPAGACSTRGARSLSSTTAQALHRRAASKRMVKSALL
jgi:hypothetical protein